MNQKTFLDISWNSIIKVVIAFLIVYLLFLIKDLLILVIFALIISVLFNPLIDFLQKRKLPRVLGAGLIYFVVFGGIGFLMYLIVRAFIPEIQQFVVSFPEYFEKIAPSLQRLGIEAFESLEVFARSAEEWLKGASANIFTALFSFFGGAFTAVFVFFLAFFFSLEEKGMEKAIRLFFPKRQEEMALSIWQKSQKKISGWFAARIICCIFVGLASFIALKIFKIDYAATLGVFAGLTNIIPYLGPIFAGLIITVLVLLEDLLKGFFILIVFVLIQQIEGNILSPVLTKRFIGLPPALVLIALIIGGTLWGFLGMILIIPLAGIVFEFIRDFLRKKKEHYNSLNGDDSSPAVVV